MQRRFWLALSCMITITVVLILVFAQIRSVRSGAQIPTPTPTYALTPVDPALLPVMPTAIQPEVVDLAPQIPYEDKPAVVVQHPDGSRTMYQLAPDTLDAFIKNLPEGDEFVGEIPPASAMLTHEAPTDTPEP